MREIKFRAWDKESEIMHKATDLDVSEDYFTAFENGVMHLYHVSSIGDYSQLEIMQFTGQKDVNCTEIYEGDVFDGYKRFVVKYDEYYGGFLPFTHDDGCGCCSDGSAGQSGNMGEVIGNIYENPELLEEEE